MTTEISRDKLDDALSRYLRRGGKINRIEKVVGEPVLGYDFLIAEDVLEMKDPATAGSMSHRDFRSFNPPLLSFMDRSSFPPSSCPLPP